MHTNQPGVCPICASKPGGNPNYISPNLLAHMQLRHLKQSSGNPNNVDYTAKLVQLEAMGIKLKDSEKANYE